jgi:hypothetical protein
VGEMVVSSGVGDDGGQGFSVAGEVVWGLLEEEAVWIIFVAYVRDLALVRG